MKFKKSDVHSKAFFTVIVCCVLALGAVMWIGVANTMKTTKGETTTVAQSEEQVQKNVNNIEKTTKKPTTDAVQDKAEKFSESTTVNAVPNAESYFVYPASEIVQKEYSNGNLVISKTLGDYRSHNGVDFVTGDNQSIKAINSGTVLSVDKDSLWGLTVEIDHGSGITAKYSGLSKASVSQGVAVKSGDEIGISGEIPIESADEPHIHLEIRVNGELKNPLEIMKKDSYN